jgi:hypothetical protein
LRARNSTPFRFTRTEISWNFPSRRRLGRRVPEQVVRARIDEHLLQPWVGIVGVDDCPATGVVGQDVQRVDRVPQHALIGTEVDCGLPQIELERGEATQAERIDGRVAALGREEDVFHPVQQIHPGLERIPRQVVVGCCTGRAGRRKPAERGKTQAWVARQDPRRQVRRQPFADHQDGLASVAEGTHDRREARERVDDDPVAERLNLRSRHVVVDLFLWKPGNVVVLPPLEQPQAKAGTHL